MNQGRGRKAGWLVCVLGWVLAGISFRFLPEQIPIRFTDGAPSAAAGRESVFLWPLIQIIVILFGRNRNMLPGALESLLTDSQYEWAVCGITGFVLLIEALVILAVLYG